MKKEEPVLVARGIDPQVRAHFGRALAEMRRARNLSQEALAHAVGLSTKASISQYENGYRFPDDDALRRLARFFRVPVAHLTGLDPDASLAAAAPSAAGTATPGARRNIILPAVPIADRVARVPIVGEVCAGHGNKATETVTVHDDWDVAPRDSDQWDIGWHMFFWAVRSKANRVVAVRVNGDSMTGADGYQDGDLLLVEATDDMNLIRDKDHLIIDLDGSGSYVLRVWHEAVRVLYPINVGHFDPITCPEGAVLYGRVVAAFHVRG